MIPYEITDPLNMKRALFIQPHPDDNEFGAGATIAKLTSEGVDIHYLTVTDGGSGSNDKSLSTEELIEIRKKEQEEASSILGVNKLHWLDFPDGHIYDSEELRRELVRVIRTVRPDIIFTVDPWLDYETHIDHIVTGKVASFAARMSGNVRFYPEHLEADLKEHRVQAMAYYTTKNPNTFMNADSFWEKKLKAIAAHKSQFSGDYLAFITNYLSYKAKESAKQIEDDSQYAESFKILPLMFLHSNVDAIDM